jgi:hypothetical protein
MRDRSAFWVCCLLAASLAVGAAGCDDVTFDQEAFCDEPCSCPPSGAAFEWGAAAHGSLSFPCPLPFPFPFPLPCPSVSREGCPE